MKLDIGSGDNPIGEGWTTVDLYHPAEICAAAWGLPFGDHEVDAIWARHVLEHINPSATHVTLMEWRRVLIHGGELIVEVPDFDAACHLWINGVGEDRELAYRSVYGKGDGPGQYHLQGFDDLRLGDLLAQYFEVPKIEYGRSYGAPVLFAHTTAS